jgi:hypothetical protein
MAENLNELLSLAAGFDKAIEQIDGIRRESPEVSCSPIARLDSRLDPQRHRNRRGNSKKRATTGSEIPVSASGQNSREASASLPSLSPDVRPCASAPRLPPPS